MSAIMPLASSDPPGGVEPYPVELAELSAQFDRLAGLAAKLLGAEVGLVGLIEADRQRFVGRSGTKLTEMPLKDALCTHAMREAGCIVVPDARRDERFCDHPLVVEPSFVRFYAAYPLVSREGTALGCLCVFDPQPRDRLTGDECVTLAALAEAATAMLERWQVERSSDCFRAQSRKEIAAIEQRFQVLADAMPQLVWSATPDGMVDYFNQRWCDFIGQPASASYGTGWMRSLHEDDRTKAAQVWANAVESGEPYEVEYRLKHHSEDYRWVLTRGLPLRNDAGEITRWLGTCTDIQEQKADAERLEMLSRELSHRIKNIFAVIGGLIAMTSRNRPEFKDVATELRDRVLALGRAHDFVRSQGGMGGANPPTRLIGLLDALLSPYQDGTGRRIAIQGDDVAVDDRSATPLALFFHELATNAAKYGALSDGNGQVHIRIRDGGEVELEWSETGGPLVGGSGRPGFGSSLVELSIGRQLGGKLNYQWRKEGLRVTARLPAKMLMR